MTNIEHVQELSDCDLDSVAGGGWAQTVFKDAQAGLHLGQAIGGALGGPQGRVVGGAVGEVLGAYAGMVASFF
jgi:hypothetical protein